MAEIRPGWDCGGGQGFADRRSRPDGASRGVVLAAADPANERRSPGGLPRRRWGARAARVARAAPRRAARH
ncbi:hypothetical protein ACWGI7_32370, partial [Streptomyces collinus]